MNENVMAWRRHEVLARLNRVRVRGFEVFESEDELRSLLERAYETPSLWRRVLDLYVQVGGEAGELRGVQMGRNRPLILTRFAAEPVRDWAVKPVEREAASEERAAA
jgi:hypothetical protein